MLLRVCVLCLLHLTHSPMAAVIVCEGKLFVARTCAGECELRGLFVECRLHKVELPHRRLLQQVAVMESFEYK